MNKLSLRINNALAATGVSIIAVGLLVAPASALATTSSTAKTAASSTNQSAKLQLIITRGNSEISRRLSTLNSLSSKINASTTLSSSDKAVLSQEVNDEISSLNALKTKLDADTDVTTAKADAQSIITDYRVYALVVPKTGLVIAADRQIAAESKLSDLATKLDAKVSAASKNAKSMQAALADMKAKIASAQTISNNVGSSVINLQPTDFNSDHNVLSGYRNQLKTAQNDLQAAVQDAKTIITQLKTQ